MLSATGPQSVPAQPNPMDDVAVAAGPYTVTATAPDGYAFSTCGQPGATVAPSNSATQQVAVAEGGSATVTFYVTEVTEKQPPVAQPTGDDDAAPQLTIVKQVCVLVPHCYYQTPADWAADTTVPSGSTVTWRIAITNTGNVPLRNITVTDTNEPDCAGPVVASLAPGASTAYTCHTDNVTATMTNTASASGTAPGGTTVTSPPGSATATVTTGVASLGIVKQVCVLTAHCDYDTPAAWAATTTVTSGATVVWRIAITNTGDFPLTDITVTDPVAPTCAGPVVASLAPGASTAYTCHNDNVTATTTNTATASGTAPGGASVTSPPASATATVPVVAPVTTPTNVPPAPTLGVEAAFAGGNQAVAAPQAVPAPVVALAATGASHVPAMITGALVSVLAGVGLLLLGSRRRRA
jgi:uncharacterized repeat protein (TIGR01451 family)